tara:strand:+ start:1381 stop:1620 length:240 start_codon:yes stop_codon:yes gene_type:complete
MKIGQIEKDIEIESKQHWNKKYPFKDMKVGDSILIEGSYDDIKKAISSAHSFASKNKKKFRCVRTFGDGEDNVRIHRTS